ncbi:hypothetical protein KL951_002486 [Ogataea haglerorum]|nr:hypothetical protein KL951_002486 [Ogataea haglerorum]
MSLLNGPVRQYYSPKPASMEMPKKHRIQLVAVAALALGLRLHNVSSPPVLVPGEAKVHDVVSNYQSGSFFLAPDPPLPGLIYAALVLLGHGSVSWTLLRSLSALFGTATVLLTYKTLQACRVSHKVALSGALLVAFDNSFVQESRLATAVSPTLFFFSLAIALTKTLDGSPSGKRKVTALLGSSIALGCLLASNWIGLATAAWMAVVFARSIWLQVGDLTIRPRTIVKDALIRAKLWLIIPVLIYVSVFAVHLRLLPNSAPGAVSLSPHFQHLLDSSPPRIADVSYGSSVSLRSFYTGKYLHSESSNYPKSGNQRVTAAETDSDKTLWFVEQRVKASMGELVRKAKFIETGRQIRLFHNATQRYLYINADEKPPLSETDYNKEVGTIGNLSWTGENWLNFELRPAVEYSSELGSKRFRAVESVFQIFNVKNKCFVMATENALPKWADGHDEVICIEKPNYVRSLWYFDRNIHPKLEGTPVEYKNLTFWNKLEEVHVHMRRLQARLPKWQLEDLKPLQWPFLETKTLLWKDGNDEIWSTGNPVVYWPAIVVVIGFASFKLLQLATTNPYKPAKWLPEAIEFDRHATDFLIGFVIHFVPFVMSRHKCGPENYLFALYFGLLLFCQWLSYLQVDKALAVLVSCLVIAYRSL